MKRGTRDECRQRQRPAGNARIKRETRKAWRTNKPTDRQTARQECRCISTRVLQTFALTSLSLLLCNATKHFQQTSFSAASLMHIHLHAQLDPDLFVEVTPVVKVSPGSPITGTVRAQTISSFSSDCTGSAAQPPDCSWKCLLASHSAEQAPGATGAIGAFRYRNHDLSLPQLVCWLRSAYISHYGKTLAEADK